FALAYSGSYMDEFINFVIDEWLLFLIFAIVFGLLMRSLFAAKLSGAKPVNVQEMLRMTNSEDDAAVILDVRTEGEFKEGHVSNSIHVPVGALGSRIKELEKFRSRSIIINCQTGARALAAAQVLKKQGFTDLFFLNGGMNSWVNANLPVEKGLKKKK
ncbi:MAG: rhodanese-like domain-containing protein, partial [Gammaproteobacteria bacterium]|nr:rhodanese-like domain-containing protein [Gammaproteobacteria bacterium]